MFIPDHLYIFCYSISWGINLQWNKSHYILFHFYIILVFHTVLLDVVCWQYSEWINGTYKDFFV